MSRAVRSHALLDEARVYVPAYPGPSGWIEIAELLDASYRLTAPKHLVRTLDSRD